MAKLKTSKLRKVNLKASDVADNQMLVNHLLETIRDMISCRSTVGVDDELCYSKQVIDSELGCDDEDALEYEQKIDQAIDGVTATKRDDAISIHTDLIIGQLDKLFKISATPIPDLPDREEDVVVQKIEEVIEAQIVGNFQEAVIGYMEQLSLEGVQVTEAEAVKAVTESGLAFSPSPEDIFEMAKQFKGQALTYIQKRATIGAKRMEKAIHDIVVETNFGEELIKFIHDYNTYPYAVLRTKSHLPFARRVWKGNKWTMEDQMLPVARRVSPHHFYWSSDSLEIDDGCAVGDTLYVKRSDLERMYAFEPDKKIKSNIAECVKQCNSFESWRGWMDGMGHDSENCHDDKASPWNAGCTVPIFRLHTLLDKCTLEEIGVDVDGGLSQYEVEVWILKDKIVRFKAFDPKGHCRPYVIEKFRHLPGKFYGKSLPAILRPVEHQIRSVKRNEILNIGFSSAPVVLRDEQAFIDESELPDVISPGDNLTVRSYPGKTMKPVEFVIAPNITNQLRAVQADLLAEADMKSQIPRVLTGQGQLGSSVRSASMLATQISGASKNLKRQMWLIALNVIKPYIEHVFEYYMEQGDDIAAKVDASVKIGSIESLVNREFLVQHIQNLIQYLAPHVQSGAVNPGVIQELLFTLMSETGISENSNNADILEEFQGIANDVTGSVGLNKASGGPALDARSNFQPIDTGVV